MKLLSPTQHKRLNEVTGFLLLSLGLVMLLSLVSYHAQDPSWDTAAAARPLNLVGYPGSYLADLLLSDLRRRRVSVSAAQLSAGVEMDPLGRTAGRRGQDLRLGPAAAELCAGAFFRCRWRLFGGAIRLGGTLGLLLAQLPGGFAEPGRRGAGHPHRRRSSPSTWFPPSPFPSSASGSPGPIAWFERRADAWRALARAHARARRRKGPRARAPQRDARAAAAEHAPQPQTEAARAARRRRCRSRRRSAVGDAEPQPSRRSRRATPHRRDPHLPDRGTARRVPPPVARPATGPGRPRPTRGRTLFQLPSTDLLNEAPGRSPYDEQELKDIAVAHQRRSSKSSTCWAPWCRSTPARWSPPSNSSPKPASSTAASPPSPKTCAWACRPNRS